MKMAMIMKSGWSVLLVLISVSSFSPAQAPFVATQAPGYYRLKLATMRLPPFTMGMAKSVRTSCKAMQT
jgi:hypothetical protein